MTRSSKLTGAAPPPGRAVHEGASAVIDLNDLLAAGKDSKVRALLRDAQAEGARAEREGRKRW